MAEEIAKTYLLETELLDISVPTDKNFDFIAIPKRDFTKVIAIEVKASKYKKSEIVRAYKSIRQTLSEKRFPVIMFYINYIDKTGFIEVINRQLTDKLIPLTRDNLNDEIKRITNA